MKTEYVTRRVLLASAISFALVPETVAASSADPLEPLKPLVHRISLAMNDLKPFIDTEAEDVTAGKVIDEDYIVTIGLWRLSQSSFEQGWVIFNLFQIAFMAPRGDLHLFQQPLLSQLMHSILILESGIASFDSVKEKTSETLNPARLRELSTVVSKVKELREATAEGLTVISKAVT